MNGIDIRFITRLDLDSVANLEILCFSDPWSRESLTRLLEMPNGGFVAVLNRQFAGYIGFLGVLDELEITNVATHPDFRRRKVGYGLVHTLLRYAKMNRYRRVTLEVRASNAPAIALYESLGFTPCGRRKNFYSHPREDGIIYEILN